MSSCLGPYKRHFGRIEIRSLVLQVPEGALCGIWVAVYLGVGKAAFFSRGGFVAEVLKLLF